MESNGRRAGQKPIQSRRAEAVRLDRRSPAAVSRSRQKNPIELLVETCGEWVRPFLLKSGLNPKVIRAIANTHPCRQRYEMEQVRLGKRPFSTKTDVFDTKDCGEIDSRLRRGSGMLNKAVYIAAALAGRALDPAERKDVVSRTRQHRAHCTQLKAELSRAYRRRPAGLTEQRPSTIGPPRNWQYLADSVLTLPGVLGAINQSDSWVVKSVRDLKRGRGLVPSHAQVRAFRARLDAMIISVRKIIEALSRPN